MILMDENVKEKNNLSPNYGASCEIGILDRFCFGPNMPVSPKRTIFKEMERDILAWRVIFSSARRVFSFIPLPECREESGKLERMPAFGRH